MEPWMTILIMVVGVGIIIVTFVLFFLKYREEKDQEHRQEDNQEQTKENEQTSVNVSGIKIQTTPLVVSLFLGCVVLLTPTILPKILQHFKPTSIQPPRIVYEKLLLSPNTQIFSFDNGEANGWKALEWNTGWIAFEKSGKIEVVGENINFNGHDGPFLKYPLDLESKGLYEYLKRNAIYKPLDEKVIGIVANVFYQSEPKYTHEKIYGGFVIPERPEVGQDYLKQLVPNEWNTLVWSLYGPIWWGKDDATKKWEAFEKSLDVGDKEADLQPGLRFDDIKIDSIGIQFYLDAEEKDVPRKFKGTVYIDNILLVYQPL